MRRCVLGRTGLEVTQLGYGAGELRGHRIFGGRPVTTEQADQVLGAVLDAGINYIDVAPDYGDAELHIGRAISHRRSEFYLASKCGCTIVNCGDHDKAPHVWTRDTLLRNIEDSLRRLRTDHLDVWQLHNPKVEQVEAGDLVAVMEEVRASGKVRFIGMSSTLPWLPRYIEWGRFDVFQIPYSALERKHEGWLSAAAASGAGVVVRGGVARGAFDRDADDRVERRSFWELARLDELLSPGMTRSQFLLRYALGHRALHTTIVGTMSVSHLRDNLVAAEQGPLPVEVMAEATRRLDAAGQSPAAVA